MKIAHHKQGFTLVELSIVLVIIGLLIGGILVGQSLIESAKINQTIQQFQSYNIAAMQFREKFKCLPGDCSRNAGLSSGWAHSTCYGLTSSTCNVGDNNGVIGNYASPATYYQNNSDYTITGVESANFWKHLNQLGYIKFTHRGAHPTSPQYGMGGWSSPSAPIIRKGANAAFGGEISGGGGWYILGIDGTNNRALTQTFTCKNAFGLSQGNYTPSTEGVITNTQALAMDSKLDDGVPLTGNVTATASVLRSSAAAPGSFAIPEAPSNASYAANCLTGSNYNTSYKDYDRNCGILICSNF